MSAIEDALPFGARPQVLTVAEFTADVKDLLKDEYPDVRVGGEISNAMRSRMGHWYFTLKDEKAQLSCVCFKWAARRLRTKPQDGLAVVARGRVDVYEQRGAYQLIVESLEPQGVGALHLQFERLKSKLQAEGLLDPERKRALPSMPRRIGIVTSPRGAAIADMLQILQRRFPGLEVRLYPARVQGTGAAEQIVEGIDHFDSQPWAEVLIVGRGGGSIEDLWAFNEEPVARAIAACRIPVVSAVGHETDFTIADFVADLRAPTPSAAAELVVPEAQALRRRFLDEAKRAERAVRLRLQQLKTRVLESGIERAARILADRIGAAGLTLDANTDRLNATLLERIRRVRERLERARRRLESPDLPVRLARLSERRNVALQRLGPAVRDCLDRTRTRIDSLDGRLNEFQQERIRSAGQRLQKAVRRLENQNLQLRLARQSERRRVADQRLGPAMRLRLDQARTRVEVLDGRLAALSPLAILDRGYAIVQTSAGLAVRDAGEVAKGDLVGVRLHRGGLKARVEKVEPERGTPPPDGGLHL